MKNLVCTIIGTVGSGIAYLFGGFDASVTTLLMFMGMNWILGLVNAAVFHKSKKSETGALESKAGWKGLIRKCVTLLFIIIANRLDMQMGTTYVRDMVCITFIANETISIVENAGLMGVPIPQPIMDAIDVLKNKKVK